MAQLGWSGEWGSEYDNIYTLDIGGESVPSIGQEPSFLDTFFQTGQRAVELWTSMEARKDLNDLNLQRARQGLAPLDIQSYMRQSAPQVQIGVTSDTQKMLLYAGGGLLLLVAVNSFLKR